MSDIITQILLALVAVGFFGDLAKGLFQRGKIKAEANLDDANSVQVIVGTATQLLEPLSKRVKEAESDAAALRLELKAAREEASKLTIQLHAATAQLRESTAENKRVTIENKALRARLA